MLATALTVFLVDEPDAATSAFGSGRAVGLMVLVAVAWLAARVVLSRLVGSAAVRLAVFGVAAAAVAAVVVLPAYDNDTVVESFPSASMAATGVSPAGSSVDQASAAQRPAAQPVLLRAGRLGGVDHRASGTARIYRLADGRYVVGLEEFDIQPGPDYDVYVVPGSGRTDRQGGARLDDLRGNRGTQFYDVPAGLTLEDGDWTVLVWCQIFGVPVANATPA